MATVPSPTSATVGQKITAAFWNAQVASAVNFLIAPPRCRAYASGNQTIANSTGTALLFDTESVDTDGIHSTVTNTSRMTIVTAGRYRVIGSVGWSANATGTRDLYIFKNGSEQVRVRQPGTTGTNQVMQIVEEILCSAGDFLELFVNQSSTVSLATNGGTNITYMQVVWVSTT